MFQRDASEYDNTRVTLGSNGSNSIRLGKEIDSGKEGVVYRVSGSPSSAVKIFKSKNRSHKSPKILAMTENKPENTGGSGDWSIIWPQKVVKNRNTGDIFGYKMQYIDSENTDNALKYSMEQLNWRDSSLQDRLTAAYNLANAVNAVHEAGHAIGDFNHDNILVEPGSHAITLIDCDGFHITNSSRSGNSSGDPWDDPYSDTGGGSQTSDRNSTNTSSSSQDDDVWDDPYETDGGEKTYSGTTHYPRYSPPENRNKQMNATEVIDVDRFCLGVHIFQLLMSGTHPFSAGGNKAVNGDPANNIQENTFPYETSVDGIEPLSQAPDYNQLPKEVKILFKKCFDTGAKEFGYERATTTEWIDTLSDLIGVDDSEHTKDDIWDEDIY